MMAEICKFSFKRPLSKEAIEERIALAIVTAECVFGQAKVRLHAGYTATADKAVIDVSSAVGEHIAQVFTGLMIRQLGEESFTIERLTAKEKP
jgi:hypothetical protein